MLSEITEVMKHTLFLIIGFLLALTAMAGGVDKQTAPQKARLFMPGKQFVEVSLSPRSLPQKPLPPLSPKGEEVSSSDIPQRESEQFFYIFNVTDEGGFVIVSGDDRTEPSWVTARLVIWMKRRCPTI